MLLVELEPCHDKSHALRLEGIFPICEKEGGPPFAMSVPLVRGLLEPEGSLSFAYFGLRASGLLAVAGSCSARAAATSRAANKPTRRGEQNEFNLDGSNDSGQRAASSSFNMCDFS